MRVQELFQCQATLGTTGLPKSPLLSADQLMPIRLHVKRIKQGQRPCRQLDVLWVTDKRALTFLPLPWVGTNLREHPQPSQVRPCSCLEGLETASSRRSPPCFETPAQVNSFSLTGWNSRQALHLLCLLLRPSSGQGPQRSLFSPGWLAEPQLRGTAS